METIDLRTLNYYCLYCREDRRAHVQAEFDRVGLKVNFVKGPTKINGESNSRVCGGIGHARVIDAALRDGGREFKPFVLLEDDISWMQPKWTIEVPTNADGVYLGTSRFNIRENEQLHEEYNLTWKDVGSPDVIQQYSMLSAHAILVLTPAYAAAYRTAVVEAAQHSLLKEELVWDILLARLGTHYNLYVVREPYLYQYGPMAGAFYETVTKEGLRLKEITNLEERITNLKKRAPLAVLYDGIIDNPENSSDRKLWTSQIGQDKWVAEILGNKRGGYFVEVGAGNGYDYSNTYCFEKAFGWKGLCIEPNDEFYKELHKNRTCDISFDLISKQTDEKVSFAQCGLSSSIMDENVGPFTTTEKLTIKLTKRLEDVLDTFGAPSTIDYLSMDAGGQEYNILKTFPFNRYKFRCITVAHNEPHIGSEMRNKIRQCLASNGYRFVKGNDDVARWGHGPIEDFYVMSEYM